jgi:hypothetical protein
MVKSPLQIPTLSTLYSLISILQLTKKPALVRDGVISRGTTLLGRASSAHSNTNSRISLRLAPRLTLGLRLRLL